MKRATISTETQNRTQGRKSIPKQMEPPQPPRDLSPQSRGKWCLLALLHIPLHARHGMPLGSRLNYGSLRHFVLITRSNAWFAVLIKRGMVSACDCFRHRQMLVMNSLIDVTWFHWCSPRKTDWSRTWILTVLLTPPRGFETDTCRVESFRAHEILTNARRVFAVRWDMAHSTYSMKIMNSKLMSSHYWLLLWRRSWGRDMQAVDGKSHEIGWWVISDQMFPVLILMPWRKSWKMDGRRTDRLRTWDLSVVWGLMRRLSHLWSYRSRSGPSASAVSLFHLLRSTRRDGGLGANWIETYIWKRTLRWLTVKCRENYFNKLWKEGVEFEIVHWARAMWRSLLFRIFFDSQSLAALTQCLNLVDFSCASLQMLEILSACFVIPNRMHLCPTCPYMLHKLDVTKVVCCLSIGL